MAINELPSPQFVKGEAGMISVFLPAFEGEPEKPLLTKKDAATLHFQRSPKGDILLTQIDEDVMKDLSGVSKILVIETNVLKSIDMLDKALTAYAKSEDAGTTEDDVMDMIERAYEVAVKM